MKLDRQSTQKPVLAIANLNHYFGQRTLRRQILCDINLEIKAQEIASLTGPSGSGKTTLLTLIGGLRTVQAGSLKFLGQELYGARQRQLVQVRRHIGYIFQSHNLLEFLTARQNVQMSLELDRSVSHAKARSQAEAMLQSVHLGEYLHSYPQQLSGGQKQRVAIARALVNRPKLVLADEPTASLDSKTGRNVIELMQRLAKEQGTAILMVTHDNRILDLADRIVRMEDGRLLTPDRQNVVRLLLVDDQSLIRRGLRALLSSEKRLQVVGEADSGETAIAQVEFLRPDVVLMDLRLFSADGASATRAIVERFPDTKILALSSKAEESVTQALQSGAAGYLPKDTPSGQLVQAIQAIHNNGCLGPIAKPKEMLSHYFNSESSPQANLS